MSASVIYSSILSGAITPSSVTSAGTVQAEQLTSTDDADITGTLTAGDATITGDITAGGGFRQQLGPFTATLAADQTDTVIRPAGVASAPGWVAQRAGSIVGFSAAISAAITGGGTTVAVSVRINGTIVAATQLDFTQAGGATEDRYAVAKDVALHTFAAGDNIDVVYTSTTITNTPVLSAWIEIEQ